MDQASTSDFCRSRAASALLGGGWAEWEAPISFVDLTVGFPDSFSCELPPWVVVGVGDRDHLCAPRLDTFLEPGFSPELLRKSVMAQPAAAAVLIQLLRIIPSLPLQQALVVESLAYATLQGSASHEQWLEGRASSPSTAGAGVVELTREGDHALAVLNRPDSGNAIDQPMRDGLREAFALVNMDLTIASITLRAKGKAFSLGADLDEFGTTRDPATAHAIRQSTLPAAEALRCSDRFFVEVDGACVGAGLELAACASHITATRRSWFQLPELAMGIIPGAGGCVSISRRIGRQRTALMVLSGRRISASTALAWGLIDSIVDDLSGCNGKPDVVAA
ncbi:Enoyl-CoA hydratase/carnithine racemase [Novosphingobium panipatense]|uniref:Enoyl-CoA hydratase/carnithine racemase n=2 Tax=Novosphingobium panipatense TaxID=428991 RepID=A0ABY1Q1S3_9SPHN|nr:Enoyl-CoA hydratase/carnithine racemase [Novosphingobium panipatense]